MKKIALLAAVAAVGLGAVSAQAALVALPPFTGTTSESFESFPNFTLPEGTPILVNAAKITSANADLVIYQPGTADFFLGPTFGNAPVQNGIKGLGLNSANDTGTVTFASTINAFGGYWGADLNPPFSLTPDITFKFYNGATLVGTDTLVYAGGGSLTWEGWFSTTPFNRVTYTGDFVVVDAIQSDAAPVPEPASATAILLSVGLLGVRRCRA